MSELPKDGCFIERILAANAEQGGTETVLSLESEIGQAAICNNITKLVECGRCGGDFKVYTDGVVFLPKDSSKCPDAVQELQENTNSVQIELRKFQDPIL